MRIAVINKDKCNIKKCSLECINVCPINRAGEKCVYLGKDKKSVIEENLCIGCGLCERKCPRKAIKVVNTPEQLKEDPIHRFGKNEFALFKLPFPVKGEVVGLLGENGLGKTTAMKILCGDIKPSVEKDLIKIFRGTELQTYLENMRNVKTVYKPQQVDLLRNISLTVEEILEKYDEKSIKNELIKKLELETCRNRELKNLSGGELQRVAIGIAIQRKADFYYFDEPSSYLDVYQRLSVAKLIRFLSKESSVLVVEHDLASLDFLADKIHIFYGVPGAFGIVSKPYSVRNGINTFLDGYIREANVKIHDPISFFIKRITPGKKEIYLEFDNIEKIYDKFSLSVSSGEIYKNEILGVFGCNALGKTTFAKMLAGEIKPDKGDVEKIKISYKPQYISTDFSGTVAKLLGKIVEKKDYKMILNSLKIENLLENYVDKLSGGELQRVAIALCLTKDVDFYLLDEPSAYLDSLQRLELAKLVKKISEQEKTFMIIDHDLLFLNYVADRAMLFYGEAGIKGKADIMSLEQGFNNFLKELEITFRKEKQTGRPRANKPGSQKDQEQKKQGKYFLG